MQVRDSDVHKEGKSVRGGVKEGAPGSRPDAVLMPSTRVPTHAEQDRHEEQCVVGSEKEETLSQPTAATETDTASSLAHGREKSTPKTVGQHCK